MAQKVLILGNSGTGKSASLRNFKEDEILVINCAGKPLPFQNHFEQITPGFTTLTNDILKALDQATKKVIVVDDAQYIMSFQYMRRIHENGWDKWNDIQGDFFNIIQACDNLPADTVVYFLSHLTKDDEGHEKIKTMGKMLDEKITIEGLFTTVLKTSVQDGKYYFLTQNSGRDTVKSPIGMFETYAIDNDLKYVDTKIRSYYEIGDYVPEDKVKAMDEEAAAPEVEKPDGDGKRRRRSRMTDINKLTVEQFDEMIQEQDEEVEKAKEERKRRRGRPRKEEGVEEGVEDGEKETESKEKPEEALTKEAEEAPKRRRRKQREPEELDSFEAINNDVPF